MKKWGIVVVCSVLILTGCKDKEEAVTEEPIINEVEENEQEVTETLNFITPLSGEPVSQKMTARPVVVTINNHPLARPQSGLAEADVIIELIAESNITRFLAVYESEMPERVGPIRSARDYFIDLANGYNAFYVAHGYSPDAKAMLDRGDIDHINGMMYDGTYFHRSSDRKAPHNSYSTGPEILDAAEQVGASMTLSESQMPTYVFSKEAMSGETVTDLTISYSGDQNFVTSYSYDTTSGFYTRSSGGIETTDAESGDALQLANVVIVEVPHQTIDAEGRQALDFAAGGSAWLYRDGTVLEVTWREDSGILRLYNGTSEVEFAPGQTWMSLIPTARGFDQMVTYSE